MADNDYNEKRNFARMKVETQITFNVKGKDQSYKGVTKNLSATGLSMETDFAPKEGDEIELIMRPNGDKLPPFLAEGNVIRITKDSSDPNKFNVSVELTTIS